MKRNKKKKIIEIDIETIFYVGIIAAISIITIVMVIHFGFVYPKIINSVGT